MALPFNLSSVLDSASLIEGYGIIERKFPVIGKYTNRVITYSDAVLEALGNTAEDFSDWPEDQGFGSSDMTYARKYFIDYMINIANMDEDYKTDFQPYLKVVRK
jgi:hypothetical protein